MQRSFIVGVVTVFLLTASVTAEDKEKDKEASFWMERKLAYSQQILNGLALEDYELIQKNAMSMKGLNTLEFFIRQKPAGYRTQLKTFEFSVNELVRNAEDQDLDGATLAFTQMAISCVNCHKELRKK